MDSLIAEITDYGGKYAEEKLLVFRIRSKFLEALNRDSNNTEPSSHIHYLKMNSNLGPVRWLSR